MLLTGANGFVGRHVAPESARQGWTVRRAVRERVEKSDDTVISSIGPRTSWNQALAGVDAVVHLAARVHHKHEEHALAQYRNVNVEGTLHLARCAAAAGVKDFIFVSTVLVHGRSTSRRSPFREDDDLTPRELYGMSKAAAEAGLREIALAGSMRVTIIRPPMIYGAGAKGNFALLERAVKRGVPLPFANVRNRRAFLSVTNLASFIVHRLSHPGSVFEVFLLADDEQVSTPEFIQRLAMAADTKARLFRFPLPLLSMLLKIIGRTEVKDSLLGDLELDLSKVGSTGWRPPVGLEEGLRQALRRGDA